MSLPEHPNGQFDGTEISKATWPRRTPFREFKGNVAHSNYDGFMFDRNIAANNTFGVTGSSHTGLENPADPNSKALESVFENLTAYKNRNGGIWGRGEMHVFRNVKFADNAIGFTHASGAFGRYAFTSQVVDSLFVGETENVGNPGTDAEKAYGRSLPKPTLPDFPIRGYEYYDYRHDVVDTTFRNYEDNATRNTGAISNLLFSSFGVSTNNAFERLNFIDAKPVYFPPMANNSKWASDNGGSASYKTAAYRDRDGSLGGGPDSYVLIHDGVNDSIAVDAEACEIKPTWNAAVCKGDIGRLTFNGPGGGFGGFGGGRGPGPGGAGGAGPGAAGPGAAAGPGGPAARVGGTGPGALGGPGAAAGPGGLPPGGPAGPGAFGARPGGAGGPPAQPPVVLSRNGKEYTVTGTNVRAGTEIKVTTERPSLNLNLTELDSGSWVIFELPGFTTAASGAPQNSLDALRKAGETSYFKDEDALWVKVVSSGDPGTGAPGTGTILVVSR
jgi:cell migration-inducing and hyaluronan-binding protein